MTEAVQEAVQEIAPVVPQVEAVQVLDEAPVSPDPVPAPTPAPPPPTRPADTYMERCIKIREAYYAGQDQFVCPHEGCDETLRIRAVPPREHLLTCASHGRILHCEL